jgi:hypothetical protein
MLEPRTYYSTLLLGDKANRCRYMKWWAVKKKWGMTGSAADGDGGTDSPPAKKPKSTPTKGKKRGADGNVKENGSGDEVKEDVGGADNTVKDDEPKVQDES